MTTEVQNNSVITQLHQFTNERHLYLLTLMAKHDLQTFEIPQSCRQTGSLGVKIAGIIEDFSRKFGASFGMNTFLRVITRIFCEELQYTQSAQGFHDALENFQKGNYGCAVKLSVDEQARIVVGILTSGNRELFSLIVRDLSMDVAKVLVGCLLSQLYGPAMVLAIEYFLNAWTILQQQELPNVIALLAEVISNGRFPLNSILFWFFYYHTYVWTLHNLSEMRYDRDPGGKYKAFWETVNRLFKERCIIFLRGAVHSGQVKLGIADDGYYDPVDAESNFIAIPSSRTLRGDKNLDVAVAVGWNITEIKQAISNCPTGTLGEAI